MPVHDDLGKRMKEYYEQIPKTKLVRRMPVVIRLDGKSFHTFTKGFERPFDDVLIKSMQQTMKYLCENIQGCVLGYQQSDEISLLLVDYKTLNSQAFFDYEVQKICSISASMVTIAFNKFFSNNVCEFGYECCDQSLGNDVNPDRQDDYNRYEKVYLKKLNSAIFDSRCFNIPKEEVTNYFYWRQLDATRNSIQMVGQANFSHKELHNKSCNMIQDMLHEQRGINWNDLDTYKKRGSCCVKIPKMVNGIERSEWKIDNDIPIFVNDGRDYIEKLIEWNA